MKKILKLGDRYTLYIEREEGRQWVNFPDACLKIQQNRTLEENKRVGITIVDNESGQERVVYSQSEFEEHCPEYWLFYSDELTTYTRADQCLIDALSYQTDLNVHSWSKGGDEYFNFFIGSVERYTQMGTGSILYKLQAQKEEIDKIFDEQIEHFKEAELVGKIVEIVGYMGLTPPREYRYENARVFSYEKEKTKVLRLIAKVKHSLLEMYTKTCNIENVLTSEFSCGEEEFVENYSPLKEQKAELCTLMENMIGAFDVRQAYVPAKSWDTKKDEEIAKREEKYREEQALDECDL